jgi:2-desacetyl-2-hydroxyethyl bacteriochlorophyllide A dehydrogenase
MSEPTTDKQAPASMRRVVATPGGIEIVDVPTPVPASDEALVRSVLVGICGSDTHAIQGRHPFLPLPYHPGHEVLGVVVGGGAEVSAGLLGRRVVVEPDLPCRACKQCRSGRQNLCENLRFFGCGYEQGGLADYFTVDARQLHVVPDALDDRTAALIEPLATPVHAVRLAGGVRDRAVVILGAGTIGLLVLQVARAQGARRIVVTARSPARRELAMALGADAVVDAAAADAAEQARAELGESADVVFDCVAVESTVRQAVVMAGKGGTIVVVGVPPGDVMVPLAVVQDSQIRIQGSATYLPEDYADAIELLVAGKVPVDRIVTAVRPVGEVAGAFEDAMSRRHVKVLVALDPAPPG